MADEILSVLGFKCDEALAALQTMDERMAALQGHFTNMSGAMSSWNSSASATTTILATLATNATNAAAAMERLHTAMGRGSTSTTAPPTVPAPAPAPAPQPGPQPGPAPAPPTPPNPAPYIASRDAAKGFGMSLEMLSRIVITQAIVRAISGIRDALSEAATSSLEFTRRVSELNSILDSTPAGAKALSVEVAKLASQFNFALGDVVKAEYQTVSASFATATQRAEVMTAAMKLATVGCMELPQAVNLITGALNSYNMSSTRSSDVAGKFFQTIRDGRVTGDQLAASLGKVMPVAAELGVSIEELNAHMVQLTAAGVKPAEAATSIRSAMMSLLKATPEMTKALHGMGFESGTDLVAAYGWSTALERLRSSTDETILSLVKMIPNIRAVPAVLRETGEFAGKAAAELEKLKKASAVTLDKVYKVFIDTNARTVAADLNKLHVWLTSEFGPKIIDLFGNISRARGGMDHLLTGITASVAPLTLVLGSLTAIWLRLQTLKLAATAKELGMAGIGSSLRFVLPVAAMVAGYEYVEARRTQIYKENSDKLEAMFKAQADKEAAVRKAKIAEETAAEKRASQDVLQANSKVMESYYANVNAAKDADVDFVADVKGTTESILAAKEKQVHILRELVTEANKVIEDSFKRTAEIAGQLSDKQFNFKLEMGGVTGFDQQKARGEQLTQDEEAANERLHKANTRRTEDEARSRAEKLSKQAATQMGTALTADDLQVAESTFKRAEAFAEMAMSAAKTAHDTNGQKEAEATIEGIMRRRITAEGQLRDIKAQQAAAAAEAAGKEEEKAKQMRSLAKQMAEETNLFKKDGTTPIDAETRKKNAAKYAEHIQEFTSLAFGQGSWDVSQFLNFDSMTKKMQDTMNGAASQAEIRKLILSPLTMHGLNEQIQRGLDDQKFLVGVKYDPSKSATEANTQAVQNVTGLADANDKYKSKLNEVKELEAKVAEKRAQIELAMGTAMKESGSWYESSKTNLGQMLDLAGRLNQLFGSYGMQQPLSVDEYWKENKKTNQLIWNAKNSPETLNDDKMADITRRVTATNALAPTGFSLQTSAQTAELQGLKALYEVEKEIITAKKEAADLDAKAAALYDASGFSKQAAGPSEEVTATKAGLDTLVAQEMTHRADGLKQGLRDGLETLNQMRDAAGQLKTNLDSAGAAAAMQQTPEGAPRAHGGPAWSYLASGGHPRGTDTMHAMLSPGEMVINAGSARRFSSELTAINSGHRPSYHSHGGSVTNVGDINVNVSGGGSARSTGRTIATEIRRELRRGSSSLS